ILKFKDGELRAGGYCLLPPSVHPRGPRYRWLIEPPVGEIPHVDLRAAGVLDFNGSCNREHAEHGDRGGDGGTGAELEHRDHPVDIVAPRITEITETTVDSFCSSRWLSVALCGTPELSEQIRRAIANTLPTSSGQRNRQVFELARELKAIPAIAD